MSERTVCDFQRGTGWRARKSNNRGSTSTARRLERDTYIHAYIVHYVAKYITKYLSVRSQLLLAIILKNNHVVD